MWPPGRSLKGLHRGLRTGWRGKRNETYEKENITKKKLRLKILSLTFPNSIFHWSLNPKYIATPFSELNLSSLYVSLTIWIYKLAGKSNTPLFGWKNSTFNTWKFLSKKQNKKKQKKKLFSILQSYLVFQFLPLNMSKRKIYKIRYTHQ